MVLTSVVAAEKPIVVWVEAPKVAVPTGTVAGDQLPLVFQSPVVGLASQVASETGAESADDSAKKGSAVRTARPLTPASMRRARICRAPLIGVETIAPAGIASFPIL